MTSAQGSVIGGAIGGASSLAGGIMGLLDSKANRDFQNRMWQKNYDAQKEFQQNTIQWRVADAQKAGIHPLAALGAMGQSYTPTSSYDSFDGLGQSIAQSGAQIGMAISEATLRKEEADARGKELDNQSKALSLQQRAMDLDNKQFTLASRQLGQNSDVLAGISKSLSNFAETQKAQWQSLHDKSMSNSLQKSTSGRLASVPSDQNTEMLEDSIFGAPFKLRAAIQSYIGDDASIQQEIDKAGLSKFITFDKQRNFQDLFMPSYEFKLKPGVKMTSRLRKALNILNQR